MKVAFCSPLAFQYHLWLASLLFSCHSYLMQKPIILPFISTLSLIVPALIFMRFGPATASHLCGSGLCSETHSERQQHTQL